MRYAVIQSKFHGGGILFESASPREAYRWWTRHHDGCFNGRGCQSLAASEDGETWYLCDIERESSASPASAYRVYVLSDEPIRPVAETLSATSAAL